MLLITGGQVINPAKNMCGQADILVSDGKIRKIAPHISLEECASFCTTDQVVEVIDATGKIVAPGLVDVHVHFRDPGFTYKEDIETGAAAAAKGGFTTVVLMANTKPTVDNTDTLTYVLEKGKHTGIHVQTCANITMGMKGQELVDMKQLAKAGAVGFTDDGIPLLQEKIVRAAMQQAKELGLPLSFHEENPALIAQNGIHAGKASAYYKIDGSPREAEIDLVKRDLEWALETGACISIQHISTKEAVELVRKAKQRGGNIHAEATPHHFTLTQDAVIEKGTMAKMNPPLREEEDRQAIIAGLADGTIDMIATDHAPHSLEEKQKPLTEAPSGIIGLETALSLGIRELVQTGKLSMSALMERMSTAPAKMYHLSAGSLEEGAAADMVIFDDKEEWKVETFVSKAANSPFTGETMPGVVYYTICEGDIVYKYQHNI